MAPWSLPVPVSRAVAVDASSQLLVLGGLATGDVSTAAVWRVDPSSGAGQRAGSLAEAVHDAAGAAVGDRVYVFGGGSSSTLSSVQSWDQSGSQVVSSLPQPRSDLAAAEVGGTVFVVGGFDGSTMDPEVLSTIDGLHFEVAGKLAVPVRYPAVAAVGGYVWIVGGQLGTAESSSVGAQSDDIQRFDPKTGSTVVVGHLPQTLGHASALDLGGHLVVAGGVVGTTSTAQIWVIDPVHGTASAGGSLPGPRSNAAAVVIGETGYLVGGELSGPTEPLDTVVELHIAGAAR